jgi:putative ABC transport system permease protein
MASLALRNLLHDRVRLVVTLTGIVFSVVLSAIQLGLFVGFRRATSDLIAKSDADVWIKSEGVTHLESAVSFPDAWRYRVLATPGVLEAEKYIANFGQWKRPDGAEEGIMIVGIEPAATMGRPWNLTAGRIEDLAQPDAVIVDELYLAKLGVTGLGDTAEIRGHRARIVGLTRGIRTFTTAPPVFTLFKNAVDFTSLEADHTLYVLVRAVPGVDAAILARQLEARLPNVDALTTDEWQRAQESYWMFGTGAGVTVLVAAGLGMLVGIVVVAQTIYAATVDHLKEYGTLKAIGAANGYIYRVIAQQAMASALVGYGVGIAIALAVSRGSQLGTTAILLPWPLVAGLAFATAAMCLIASIVSIRKATRIDPAMVFRT